MTTLILSVIFSISASAYDVEVDGIYYNIVTKAKTAEVTEGDNEYSGDVTIPETITVDNVVHNVTSIGDYAFEECSSLTSITIPNSVTSIGEWAFSYCSGLTSVTIPNSVTSIGEYTFYECSGLTSVTIPNSVTSIGNWAFSGCGGLTSITIPNSVTSIRSGAFSRCNEIENVYCYAETVPSTKTDAFSNSNIEYATLHVPASAINAYKTTKPWSAFGTFKTLEGTEVEKNKCETPTIAFIDGKLTFSCATEDVEYVSEVKCSDVSKYYTNEISLAACYDISVTAMKTGYVNSDIATAINGTTSFAAQSGSIVVAKIGKENIKIAVK